MFRSEQFFSFIKGPLRLLAVVSAFTLSCSAQSRESTALESLRETMARGVLPSESVAADIEGRYAGTSAGALARLLRAHIRLSNGDSTGAAALLETDSIAKLTSLGDYALWLRGRALMGAGREQEARAVFADLLRNYPGSIRARDARLMSAESLIRSGDPGAVPALLRDLVDENDGDAVILAANAFEKLEDKPGMIRMLRKAYFYAAGTESSKQAAARLETLGESTEPVSADDLVARANDLFKAGKFDEAAESYRKLFVSFPADGNASLRVKLITALSRSKNPRDASAELERLPSRSAESPEAHYQVALGYAKARLWLEATLAIGKLREVHPDSEWAPKAMIDAGLEARDQKRRGEESQLLAAAVAAYPNAIDVAQAQFELSWMQHESGNFEISSRMLTEHLARYVDKDSTYRGQTGYWAARDSERAGKLKEACALYDATAYRYGANWYGHLALGRITGLRRDGKCQGNSEFSDGSVIGRAVANLKVVTVASETAGADEVERLNRSADLSSVGLFDWSLEELKAAGKTASTSPSVNLALAQHYRLKGDNVNALLSLRKSYPDYAQMFPEEMSQEVWDIFYPLSNWGDIKFWAGKRELDPYVVAGLIRQETIFSPRARSSANAYGLMQLLIPTARTMARKYGSNTTAITAEALYRPALNIELGTAYMKEQLSKYGRIEFMSVAYNAGPGRVVSWRKTLPEEIDEFVEEIPFRETKGYVQGVIRNTAQYRRLYDANGNFKANVGTRPVSASIDRLSPDEFAKAYPHVEVADVSR